MTADASPDALQLRVEKTDGQAVVHVHGELDPHTAPILQGEIDRLVEEGSTDIVLDLSGLGFVDSSGLRVVIRGQQDVTRAGGQFALRNPSPTAKRLLEITGLNDLVDGV